MALQLPDRGTIFYVGICDWLLEQFAARECDCQPHAYFFNDIGMDSIDIAELTLYCDDRFGFERIAPGAGVVMPLTVMDMVDYCIANSSFNKTEPDTTRGPGYRRATAWSVS